MKFFKLVLSEKREKDDFLCETSHDRYIKAENRDNAYNKALKTAAMFLSHYPGSSIGIPDKDFIFWFSDNYIAIWINSLEEIEIV